MNLPELFKEYLLAKTPPSSKVTVKNYLSDIRAFVKWFEDTFKTVFDPSAVSIRVIEDYITQASTSTRSNKRYLSSLRRFFAFLEESQRIQASPFQKTEEEKPEVDPWQVSEFKNFLFTQGASHLTIKNYVIDIRSFRKWYETTIGTLFFAKDINPGILYEYRQRLIHASNFAPRSVNRKLSSLRRFIAFAQGQAPSIIEQTEIEIAKPASGGMKFPRSYVRGIFSPFFVESGIPPKPREAGRRGIKLENIAEAEKSNTRSKIAPVRLASPIFTLYSRLEEKGAEKIIKLVKTANIPSFGVVSKSIKKLSARGGLQMPIIRNVEKEFYAAHMVSTASYPFHKKVYHHLRFTRPNWYKRYHNYAFAHYFHFALLVVYASGVGFMLYQGIFAEPTRNKTLAAPAQPLKVYSFQGRLTDATDNPITTSKQVRFMVYNSSAATGAAELWEEVRTISPDTDGIFSVLLASAVNGTNAADCGAMPPASPVTGACGIPQSLFRDNSQLFLGVTIGNDTELTPRQQIATVAYATNAEVLQGLPPITQASAGTTNVVLALDSSGNLTIGGSANPIFSASGGTFTLTGQPLLLKTNASSNGNIQLVPDGLGKIDIQKPIVNFSNSGNLSPGAVEVDDKFSVLATESAVAAFVINNNTAGGDIFTASSSGTPKFTIQNDGTIVSGKYTSQNGVLYGAQTTGVITQATTASTGFCLLSGASNPSWSACPGGADAYWNQQNGSLFANNSTVDFLAGGQSTGSAAFRVTGQANPFRGTLSAASVSANTSFAGFVVDNKGVGDLIAASSSGVPNFVVQNNGNVIVGLGGNGKLTAAVLDPYLVQNQKTTGTTTLTMQTMGGAGADIIFQNQSTDLMHILQTGNVGIGVANPTGGKLQVAGDIVPEAGGTRNLGTPSLVFNNIYATNVFSTGGISGFWQQGSGSLFPLNSTLDFFIGGQATLSAKFAVLNMNSGTPTASIAGNFSLGSAAGTTRTIGATAMNNLQLGDGNTGGVALSPAGTTALYAQTGGNVGIGTTNPGSKLDVNGVIHGYGGNGGLGELNFSSDAGNSAGRFQIRNDAADSITDWKIKTVETYALSFGTANTTRMTIDTSGNVGIGTTGPGAKVDIAGSVSSDQLRIGTSSDSLFYKIGRNSADGLLDFQGIQTSFTGYNFKYSDGTSRLYIKGSDGNVGLGTTTPLSELHVTRPLSLAVNGKALVIFDQIESQDILTASAAGVPKFSITNAGGIKLGTSVGTGSQCITGGATAAWGTCGSGSGNSPFQELSGAIVPNNSTEDFLLGSQATLSAKFAVLNINSGTPTATISGNMIIMPNNGAGGMLGIGTTTPSQLLTMAGGNFLQTASTNPTVKGSIQDNTNLLGAQNVYVSERYAYITASNSARLTIVDIANPASPAVVSSIQDTTNLGGAFGLDISGKFAYIAASTAARFTVVDVSDPKAPTVTGSVQDTAKLGSAGNVVVAGKYAYVTASASARLNVIDISSPGTPTIVGSVNDATNLAGALGLYILGKFAYVTASAGNRVAVVDISNPNAPIVTGSIVDVNSLSGASSIYVSGRYAYVTAKSTNRFTVVDVSNPHAPTITATLADNTNINNPINVFVSGNYAYLTSSNSNRVTVVDITTPSSPAIISSLADNTNLSNPFGVYVAGKYAYVTSYYGNRLTVVDINGIDVPTANIGNLASNAINVLDNVDIGDSLFIRNGLNVGNGGIFSQGSFTFDVASTSGNFIQGSPIGNALLTLNNNSTQDLFTASASGLTKFVINSNGNVGIGTANAPLNSAPWGDPKFQVFSNLGTSPVASFSGKTSAPALFVTNEGVGDYIVASATGVTKFRVRNNGDTFLGNYDGTNGSGKLYASGVDPLYTIDGGRYSTFGSSILGMKEEITGKVDPAYNSSLGAYAYTLDFNSFQKDSDLWVFSRIIDPDLNALSILLTPSSQARTWYKTDPTTRKITLYSDRPTEISYRMTGNRFDYKKWPTISDEYSITGIIAPPPAPPVGSGNVDSQDDFFANVSIKLHNGIFQLVDNFGNSISKVDAFSKAKIADLTAGYVRAQALTVSGIINAQQTITKSLMATTATMGQLTTNSLNITSDSVNIAGKSLQTYIADTVQSILNTKYQILNTGRAIVSPLASIDEIHTNLLSPLAGAEVALKGNLDVRGQVSGVRGKFEEASVSGILSSNTIQTNEASISGNLAANSVQTNNASVSGTLNAGHIVADSITANSIEGLDAKIASLAAQSVASQQYLIASTSSKTDLVASILNTKYQIPNTGFLDIQSMSADFGTFRNGLIALGPTTLNQATILDSLSIGTNLTIGVNSINLLGGDLEIQPLKQGGVSFLAGLVHIDTEGNLDVQGNATFAKDVTIRGKLSSNIISPLPNQDLAVSIPDSRFKIQDSSGSAVLSINNSGDLVSSGAATFNKLNLSFAPPVYAADNTTATASGSAGTALIKQGHTELTIENPNVTDKSLIYITPVGQNTQVYLLRQVANQPSITQGSFSVGTPLPALQDIQFNWIIVN